MPTSLLLTTAPATRNTGQNRIIGTQIFDAQNLTWSRAFSTGAVELICLRKKFLATVFFISYGSLGLGNLFTSAAA